MDTWNGTAWVQASLSPTAFVTEFHRAFDLAIGAQDTPKLREFRADLVNEEYVELDEQLYLTGGPLESVAKELADLVYVAYGTAISLGIDLDEALRRVHASNMSKLGPDGKPKLREDGKILKPDTYVEPDMTGVVAR